jgi:diguanylate cyclase (GGDEF)-like protein
LGFSDSGPSSGALQSWLVATLISAVTVFWLVFAYTQEIGSKFEQESMAWSLAAMFAMLGLPLVLATASRITVRKFARIGASLGVRTVIGTCLMGIAFVLHGISLLREQSDETLWWLPILAIGMLLVLPLHPVGIGGDPEIDNTGRSLRGSVLAMLAIIGCISAADLAVLLNSDPAGTDWALIVVSGWVLMVSALTVCVSALRFDINVTELSRRVSILAWLSQTDPLTGITNRRGLDERLATEIQRAARFGHSLSIALIDVDDFKRVNDTYGHAAGDQVLRRLATLLVRELRTIDVIGRYGGEEFLVILPETDLDGAATAAARLLTAVRTDAHRYLGRGSNITVSIGIAAFERDGRTSAELLDAADRALYQAKRRGKDQVVIGVAAS